MHNLRDRTDVSCENERFILLQKHAEIFGVCAVGFREKYMLHVFNLMHQIGLFDI